jgi:hypothetical protein
VKSRFNESVKFLAQLGSLRQDVFRHGRHSSRSRS